MDITHISESRRFKTIITIIVVLVGALVIFQVGVFVGYRKAVFSEGLGDNYYRAFSPREKGMVGRGFEGDGIPGGHGAVGKVIKTSSSTLIVEGPDNIEKQVFLTDSTLFRRFKESILVEDIKVGDYVIVIGSPNKNGQVEAGLIRLIPPPPQNASTTKNI